MAHARGHPSEEDHLQEDARRWRALGSDPCSDYTNAATGRPWARTNGRMTSGCPISTPGSPAKLAARGAPTFDRISAGKKRPDARRFPDDTSGVPNHEIVSA